MANLTKWSYFSDKQSTPTNAAPGPGRKRRIGTAALLGLTLAGGAIGGGAIGTTVAARWLAPHTAQAPVIAAQPIAQAPRRMLRARSWRPLALRSLRS